MVQNNLDTKISLRNIIDGDLPIFFKQQKHKDATWMAAFISRDPEDRESFDKHWANVRNDENIDIRTILFNDLVAGNIVSYIMDERRVVGY